MIPEAAVEAAREALEDALGYGFDDPGTIRAVLEAAAPHMLARAWDEGALWRHHASGAHNGGLQWFQSGYPAKPIDAPNPYRPTP